MEYDFQYYESTDFEQQYEHDTLIYAGKWVESCLAAREKSADGRALRGGNFAREYISEYDGRVSLNVSIQDISFDFEKKLYKPRTMIWISFVEHAEY